ncbi:hypothetical protein FPE01S_01_15360 [Flavihumibacter petaseus NBRC 106054]|uniref:Uncharacterized protein n=2 Tax=Flavihumibacter TaxID=1004301 RepID=A0A0E9MYN5_9BACT|nr:hypothetical protein FPE01S_01_15360 [Flavihumibacter petaseus NBRC 106054]
MDRQFFPDQRGESVELNNPGMTSKETTFLYRPVNQNVGGAIHNEFWVPAEELDEFNSNIVGRIEVTRKFD